MLEFNLAPSRLLYNVRRTTNPHPRRTRSTAAQKAGLRYEAKALSYLTSLYPSLVTQAWFSYNDPSDGRLRFCSPDAYYFSETSRLLTVFEVKLRWNLEAVRQLRLYVSILSALYVPRTLAAVCVTRAFDPAVPREVEVRFLDDVAALPDLGDVIGVHIWRK